MITSYLALYLVTILIVDWSGFQENMPLVKKMIIKYPVMGHLVQCSLCTTFWLTMGFVLFGGISPWFLVMPWGARIVSGIVGKVYDLFSKILS